MYLYSNILHSQAKYSEVSTAWNVPWSSEEGRTFISRLKAGGGGGSGQEFFLLKRKEGQTLFFGKKKFENSPALSSKRKRTFLYVKFLWMIKKKFQQNETSVGSKMAEMVFY